MNFLFASLFAVFTAAIASQGNTTDWQEYKVG